MDDDDDDGSSPSFARGSSAMREDISTAWSSVLRRARGKGGAGGAAVEEGDSLLISSPMMARGAQPYMAQDLLEVRLVWMDEWMVDQ